MKDNKLSRLLCFTDLDGTFLDSKKAILRAQAKAFSKLSGNSYQTSIETINNYGLKNVVEEYVPLNEFFDVYYKSFDPQEEYINGNFSVFEDALRFTNNAIPLVAISNSTLRATQNKLNILEISHLFEGIYANYESGKAKPSLYLGYKAIQNLKANNLYDKSKIIIAIGDQDNDLKFAENLKNIHPNTLNVLINRTQGKLRNRNLADIIVCSFDELSKKLGDFNG